MSDAELRAAAIQHVTRIRDVSGGVLTWGQIAEGFTFRGDHVHLATKAKGIFRPAQLQDGALSISTRIPRDGRTNPYEDLVEIGGGLIRYHYRGSDPGHPDNRGIRACLERHLPIIYFIGIAESIYRPEICRVAADDQRSLAFTIIPSEGELFGDTTLTIGEVPPILRRYAISEFRRRLHQHEFRDRVLNAYARRCAICQLRHEALLVAAHIVPDCEERGVPAVPNGLCLCSLHHSAYDAEILGIAPDFSLHVRPGLMRVPDGPVHEHGLKRFDNGTLHLPNRRADHPDPKMLEIRWTRFEEVRAV